MSDECPHNPYFDTLEIDDDDLYEYDCDFHNDISPHKNDVLDYDEDDDYAKMPHGSYNLPPGVEASLHCLRVLGKHDNFRRFNIDTVEDFSDNHYWPKRLSGRKRRKENWINKIRKEWRILEKDLPDSIFVRVCERRKDLLRAVIVGPADTPYHNGLFTFDALFPLTYPNEPPMVFFYTGGLQLHPNFDACGKVCLSLLGTSSGPRKQTEQWIPGHSTMLQVLCSIRALFLNAQPYINEPRHDLKFQRDDGRLKSRGNDNEVFLLSLKTMVHTLEKPPRHFEDLVVGHFLRQAHNILSLCKSYFAGASVGFGDEDDAKMMDTMITIFKKNGSIDCEKFGQMPEEIKEADST